MSALRREFNISELQKEVAQLRANVNSQTDREALEAEVKELRQNIVSPKSKGIYRNSQIHFLMWLLKNERSILPNEFVSQADVSPNKRKFIKSYLNRAPEQPPLTFQELEASLFMVWIASLRKKDGERPSLSTYKSHRAGLFNLFRSYEKTMSRELETELAAYYLALKRAAATLVASGVGKVKIGKDPLPSTLFKFLCTALLLDLSRESIFARTFMILAWNLMSRSKNTFNVHLNHMEWKEDSLQMFFSQMKNDQMAEKPRDPRHVYANPLMPEICPILALAIFWLCFGFVDGETQLFPGSNQYERFRKYLARVVLYDNILEELERRGLDPSEIASHSIRKGATGYAASGSTACPPITAVNIRGGWSLGGVQDTYMRYEAAGDMYVGRTVNGLPINSYKFAMLPPHFVGLEASFVRECLGIFFPGMPSHLFGIGEMAIASLVYHRDWLLNSCPLPPNHPLCATVLCRNETLYKKLKSYVVCSLPNDELAMQPTGIPPHVLLLGEMKTIAHQLERNLEKQNENIQLIINGVMKELEAKAVGLGTVTQAGLKESLMNCLEDAGVMRIVRRLDNPGNCEEKLQEKQDISVQSRQTYMCGGKFDFVPVDFHLPKGSVVEAWRNWCMGDERLGYPPFKSLRPDDFSNKNARKRLSDYRFMMMQIEQKASDLGIHMPIKTEQEAVSVFERCKSVVSVPHETVTGKRRRTGQLSWLTVVDFLRCKSKESHSSETVYADV